MTAKLRVMRIISDLPVGGVENRLLALLPKLQNIYDVRICCIRAPGALADDFERAGIPVIVKYFKSRLHPFSLYQLAAYMRQEHIDIVHTHMYRPNVSGVIAARLAGVPVVISQVHNVEHWDNKRQLRMDSRLSGWRDRVVAVSEAVRQDYIKQTGTAPEKCVVLYNGIDISLFDKNKPAVDERERWGIGRQDKVVGIIARLVPQKDHLTFIQAAQHICRVIPQVKFLIVGEEEGRGGVLEKLNITIAELGLTRQVIFTGTRKNIAELLGIMDVSVLSSIREGFSNVVLESMAAGVPMVVTDVGGNAEAILDGVTGFVVPPRSPQALAQAIINILQDDTLAASMCRASRERAKLFSLDAMYENTITLYQGLSNEKNV